MSPRYVPDAIFAVPEIPQTLNGKKLEVPVKLAGKEPSTEQGLRVSGTNLGDDDRPFLNPPYAKPDRPCMRLFKHPLRQKNGLSANA